MNTKSFGDNYLNFLLFIMAIFVTAIPSSNSNAHNNFINTNYTKALECNLINFRSSSRKFLCHE